MVNIVVITAHPDDEIIWFGSTLYELQQIPNINIHIICLWAILEPIGSMKSVAKGYKDSDRETQFYDVIDFLNFDKSYIITYTKHSVNQQIPQTDKIIEEEFLKALNNIYLNINQISMIITHSFYGDERKHPHHIRLYEFFSKYTLDRNIGFGFFSILKIPDINHKSILHSTYRLNQLHLLSYEIVEEYNITNNPNYIIEFQGNLSQKIDALKLYKAIDFDKHYNDYMGFSNITEKLYFNNKAKIIIDYIINNMKIIVKNII